MPLVNVVTPDGKEGTVPDDELHLMPPGTQVMGGSPPKASADDGGGLLGAAAAGVFGAGSSATLGLSDRVLREGAYVLGGPQFRHDVTSEVSRVREAHPYATTAGELGGLLLNPEAITGVGEAAGAPVAARAGEGLLAKMATDAARVGAETAAMGAQHQVTEDALGDHEYNGEAIFANAAKDALIGAPLGAALGLGGGLLGKAGRATGLLARRPGPIADATLDELAGVEGAGRRVRDDAASAQQTIDDLRAGGATSEQAAQAVGSLDETARAKAETAPWARSVFDPATEAYTSAWGPEKGSMDRYLADRGNTIAEANARTERNALTLRQNVTDVLRNGKDVADNVQFTQRPDRFAKLVDTTKGDAQADAIASLLQETDKKLAFWENLNSQGGEAAASVRKLRDLWLDLKESLPGAKRRIGYDVPAIGEGSAERMVPTQRAFEIDKRMGIDADAGLHAPEGPVNESTMLPLGKEGRVRLAGDAFKIGGERVRSSGSPIRDTTKYILGEEAEAGASRARPIKISATFEPDGAALNTKANAFKQALDRNSAWGRGGGGIIDGERFRVGIPGATQDITDLADHWRAMLEDTGIWGDAGRIQSQSNKTFSDLLPREQHLMQELAADIDVSKGMHIPEGDYSKAKSFLDKITGNPEVDEALQPVISARRWIDGMRARMAALREGGITEGEAAKFAKGSAAVDSFEKTLNGAMKDAAETNRIKAAVSDERSRPGLGGILGLVGDAVTKPYTTLERLAHVRHTVESVESGVRKAIKSVFSGGKEASGAGVKAAAESAPRPKAKIVEEMQAIRELAGNPAALETAVHRMTGDLRGYAPKTADAVRIQALRTILYLAQEAPPATTTNTGLMGSPTPRYSDIQVHDWETKRNAAFDPRTALKDMKHGVLNRDAIQTAEQTSPKLFAMMQAEALNEIQGMQARGELDSMPYQRKAVIAALLKIPADATWEPDFIAMMQGAMAQPPPAPSGPAQQGSKLARKTNKKPLADSFMTAADHIESGGQVQ